MTTSRESELKDFSLLCRSCLATCSDMKNMLEWGYAEDFYKLTSIPINTSDDLSELLCTTCVDLLLSFRGFVQQSIQSDYLLKEVRKHLITSIEKSQDHNTITVERNAKELIYKIKAPKMDLKINLPCHQCSETFLKKSDLTSHLLKKHKIVKININVQFYCSIPDCIYSLNSGTDKFFSGRKYLNQHVSKVHKAKHVPCHNCNLNFTSEQEFNRHLKTCNFIYICKVCDIQYNTNEKLLVHLLRKHPDLHKKYKAERKAEKRKMEANDELRKIYDDEKFGDICDSPKRSFATQTPEVVQIKYDVTLPSWRAVKQDGAKKDEISTQTVFQDILSQNSEDDIFFNETVSLSDIQTQTIPLEFGLSRSNKQTITSETQSPDLSIKETQTCISLWGSKLNSVLTSTETQTYQYHTQTSDPLMSFTSTETQTCLDDMDKL